MKSFIFGGIAGGVSGTTGYYWIANSYLSFTNATQANRDTVVPHAMTLDRLRVILDTAAPGVGKSYVFTVMKNGVATALTCTVADANQSAADTTNSVSFAAGDTISLQSVAVNAPTTVTYAQWSIRQDAADVQGIIGGASQNVSATVVNYNGLSSTASWNATLSSVHSVMPTDGVLKNLTIMASAAAGAAKSYAFEILVNGVASGVVVTITGTTATTGSNTANTVAVSAGDTVALRCTPTGTPTAANIAWSCSFDPTTDGESVLLYGDNATPSASATNYEQPLGRGENSWSTAENLKYIRVQAATLKAAYFLVTTAPASGKSWTFNLRQNLADSTAAATIADAATTANATGLSVALSDDDRVSLKAVPSGTPTVSAVKVGAVLYVAPSGTPVSTSDFLAFF